MNLSRFKGCYTFIFTTNLIQRVIVGTKGSFIYWKIKSILQWLNKEKKHLYDYYPITMKTLSVLFEI